MMKTRHAIAALLVACSGFAAAQQPVASPLVFTSSNASLQQSFDWAKQQALTYARPAAGVMGPWYEAALAGRNAFCMRDVSHQTEGAAALGLHAANRNMLRLFAQSIAKSRDWAAYWEIDGEGHPSSADYVSDTDFWFNLPANFDVLDAATRMWRWTGDDSYCNDPAFQHFFRVTMTDYMRIWQLTPDTILNRPRIANQRQAQGRFVHSRGIPSYTEGSKDFIFGTDLLASEYRAIRSFQEIASTNADRKLAQQMQPTADAIQDLLERVAWSKTQQHYLGTIRKDLSGSGSGDGLVLYFRASKDPAHLRGALDYVSSPNYWKHVNIEEETYLPLTLFRYGRAGAGYQILRDLSSPQKDRREYPEVSYAVIAALVSGVMGLEPRHSGEPFDVRTLSLLPATDRATLSGVAIGGNHLEITHIGQSQTRLKNNAGPALRWRAAFISRVDHLRVNAKLVVARQATLASGETIIWTDVIVPPAAEVIVSQ
ncbi:MAG TPA: hypothetical protein VGG59_07095 [Acidobacteriaceae bacterium]